MISSKRFMAALLALTAAFAAAAVSYAGDVATDMELTGANDVDVPSGETWTYSGVISGSGSIRKIGAGTLVLNNAANTFTGGITITNGVVRADREGCLGTGRVFFNNASAGKIFTQLQLNAADATFANNMHIDRSTSNSRDRPYVRFMKNTTLSGSFYSYSNEGYISADSGVTATFTGSVSTYNRRVLYLAGYGKYVLKGAVTLGTLGVGGASSMTVTLEIDSDSFGANTVSLWGGSAVCKRSNALNGCVASVRQSSGNSASHYDLSGFNQTISAFGYYGADFPTTGTGYEVQSPSGAATLTVTGGAANASCICYLAINNEVTLLLDADPTYTCRFSKRANGTRGDIVVSNGTFSVTDTATFKNVPRIVVADGGVFSLTSTGADALAGARTLEVAGTFRSTSTTPFTPGELAVTVDAGATLDFGYTLNVKSLTMRGVSLDEGRYTHSDYEEIAEGTELVVPAQKKTVRWTGAGADENIATALNWAGGETPNLAGGGLTPVFADGGVRALIDRFLYLDGLTFAGDGFTLKQDGDDGQVTVAGGAMSFEASAGNPVRTFALDVPFSAVEAQLWNLPSNTTFELKGGFSAASGVAKGGDGNLTFTGTNAFAGALVITNGTTTFAGTVTTPTGADASDFTYANSIRCYGATSPSGTGTRTGAVVFDNAVIEKPFFTLGPNVWSASEVYLTATANSSNVVRGVWVTGSLSWQKLKQPDSAVTVFEGGISNLWTAYLTGGTVYVRNRPQVSNCNSHFEANGGFKLFYEASGGYLKTFNIGSGEVHFLANYAEICDYVTNTSQTVWINLHSTTQRFSRVQFPTAANVRIDGEPGSALEVAGSGASCIAADLTNGVSLVKFGAGTLTLRKRAFSSTGDIVVTNGTLVVADDASWKGAARVVVSGSGNLTIERTAGNLQSQAFGKRAEVHLSDDAVLTIPDGSVQRVAYLFVDGVRQPTGRYTYSAIADANVKKHFSATTGTLKCIGTPGFIMSVR